MDGITAHALRPELDSLLAGSQIDRISMEDRHTLKLLLFAPDRRKYSLSLAANPSRPGLSLTLPSGGRGLNPPPAFVMYLRKHLGRARLLAVESPPWERVFNFQFLALDELGDELPLELVFECMPRTANLILLNRDQVIMGALRTVDHRVNRYREILPAHPYLPPPPQKGLEPQACLGLPARDWEARLDPALPVGRAVSGALAGFSPRLGREAAYRAGLDPGLPLNALKEGERGKLREAALSLCREALDGPLAPAIYYDGPEGPGRRPLAVHALPLTHLPWSVPYPTMTQALASYQEETARLDRFDRRRRSLAKRIGEQSKRVQKKRQLHEADLAEGREADQDRLKGELILAWLHTIPPGAEKVELENYHESGAPVSCALDPRWSPAENANRYFARARRKERKLQAAGRLLAKDLDELAWLESLAAATGYAESEEDLLALEQEYRTRPEKKAGKEEEPGQRDSLPGRPASKKRRMRQTFGDYRKKQDRTPARGSGLPAPPRAFKSSDGFSLLSGRNNLQNDSLLRRAARQDLWFHVKNRPGSHVILVTGGRPVPDRALEEAAGIAAWYSDAGRSGAALEVDYAQVGDVKKIPGSRPGNVTYDKFKTLYVRPLDPADLAGS